MKTIKELRKLSAAELEKTLKSTQESLFKLRFQKVVEDVTDTTQIKKNKRKIAQIKTLMTEQELQKSKEPQKV